MRGMTVSLAAVVLYGCATADEIYMPDGRMGYAINCGGTALSMNSCFTKASDLCGARGYDVFNQSGEVVPFAFSPTAIGVAINREVMIACK